MILTFPCKVCKGDTIVVDVKNHMLDREVTIHWHGVYMKQTPWMDGVPMVTQCPIPTSTTFRYKFPALPSGTFFYHSHVGKNLPIILNRNTHASAFIDRDGP